MSNCLTASAAVSVADEVRRYLGAMTEPDRRHGCANEHQPEKIPTHKFCRSDSIVPTTQSRLAPTDKPRSGQSRRAIRTRFVPPCASARRLLKSSSRPRPTFARLTWPPDDAWNRFPPLQATQSGQFPNLVRLLLHFFFSGKLRCSHPRHPLIRCRAPKSRVARLTRRPQHSSSCGRPSMWTNSSRFD